MTTKAGFFWRMVLAGLLWLGVVPAATAQPLRTNTPVAFFTDAANRILANARYTFGVTNIQVWPTNFYTPSVHRFLQVAANLYDATALRANHDPSPFPTIFRPIFGPLNSGACIGIVGYQQVTDASIAGFGPGERPTCGTWRFLETGSSCLWIAKRASTTWSMAFRW